MALYLGILIFSFILTGLLMIPFINLLYRLHLTYHTQIPALTKEEEAEFSQLHQQQTWKFGTPVGGGILIIAVTSVLFVLLYQILTWFGVTITSVFSHKDELNIIFFTFVSFALLGLYDDIIKIFNIGHHKLVSNSWPRRKTFLIFCLSFFVAIMMHLNLDISIIYVPLFGVVNFGWWYVPIATLVISVFCKAFDITDGLDGLAPGILLFCLIAFWAISLTYLDTVISLFLALFIGSLIAFVYFNVYPARIWLGNAGSLSFGATLAIIGLLLGKTFALLVVGSVFILEAVSQMAQIISVTFFKKKIFSVTPIHYWLQSHGWSEPKIVMRFWLLTIFMAILGLWFATV
jgi:phospho-N-acetylmuramoyl-pentapeptide-transferase